MARIAVFLLVALALLVASGSAHGHCGHDHDPDDHDHHDRDHHDRDHHDHDHLGDEWVGVFTDDKGVRHEIPAALVASNVALLTPGNVGSFLASVPTSAALYVFVYDPHVSLALDYHPRFAAVAAAVAATELNTTVRFAQLDARRLMRERSEPEADPVDLLAGHHPTVRAALEDTPSVLRCTFAEGAACVGFRGALSLSALRGATVSCDEAGDPTHAGCFTDGLLDV